MITMEQLERLKLIAIVRGLTSEQADRTIGALYEGGIRFIEATMNTPGAAGMIARWRERYDQNMMIGAGTVIDIGMAKEAYTAGAQFLVAPNMDREVIEFAIDKGIGVFPGAFTPTEIIEAWKTGATAVKLFPTALLGIEYFREIRGPLDQIPLIPTGGIRTSNIGEFIRAGAYAFGLGNSVVDKKLIAEGRYDELTANAAQLTEAVSRALS